MISNGQPVNHQYQQMQLQESYEMVEKLLFAQQKINIIELEKVEYEREINRLREQNEKLSQENKSFYKTIQIKQEQILILHSISTNAQLLQFENNNLKTKVFEYEKVIKSLKYENKNSQKENEKYKIILEELNKEKQKRVEIYTNNRINIENQMTELQTECDELRKELNAINLLGSPRSDLLHYEFPTKCDITTKRSNDLFRLKPILSPKPSLSEFLTVSYSESTSPMITDNDFTYETNDRYNTEMEEKLEEIERLKDINTENEEEIQLLQNMIKFLKQKNRRLDIEKKIKTEKYTCSSWRDWFS